MLKYKFKNEAILNEALTHSSYANENGCKSYERLEFLGDSVLSLIISEYLFEKYDLPEGELSKIRARIVCESALEKGIGNTDIASKIMFSKGEEQTGGRTRPSILADVFEAITAAIYKDGGILPAKEFVLENLKDIIPLAVSGKVHSDYKTALQEVVQAGGGTVRYVIASEDGPEHNKIFTVDLLINDVKVSSAQGRSKKEAEQNAAKKYLK